MVNLKDSSVLDIVRYIFSLGLLLFSGVVVCYSILEQKTSMWKEVPGWASLLIFIFVLWCLGVMEGLQIALVELKKLNPDYYKDSHPTAYKLGQLACKGDNIERFLMGRQVFVVCSVFFAAKLTTIHGTTDGFLFYVPDWVQAIFLETGLLACVVVVIVAQLMPQIVASIYPVQFLELLVMRPAYWACIALESTGLTHFCWVLAHTMAWLFRMEEEHFQIQMTNEKKEGDDDIAIIPDTKHKILGESGVLAPNNTAATTISGYSVGQFESRGLV